jgi:TatD DNase family protein
MSRFIDIHTHKLKDIENQIRVFDASRDSIQSGYNSLGIHPWFIDKSKSEEQFLYIDEKASKNEIVAIGECGLDRAIETPIALQEEIFIRQIELAEKHGLPLIIHCVKAYSDMLRLRKRYNKTPWILHGFYANEIQTKQLLTHDFHFSMGEKILNPGKKFQQAMDLIPVDRLFLETDDSSADIKEIYKACSSIMKIELSELQDKILLNFARVFKRD